MCMCQKVLAHTVGQPFVGILLETVRSHKSGWWELFNGSSWYPVCSSTPSTDKNTADTLCKIAGFAGVANFSAYQWYVQLMARCKIPHLGSIG